MSNQTKHQISFKEKNVTLNLIYMWRWPIGFTLATRKTSETSINVHEDQK